MKTWLILWTALLLVAVVLFTVLAVVVSIAGYFDIRAMLRHIEAQHKDARHRESKCDDK